MSQISASTLMISIQCLNMHNNALVQEINKRVVDEREKSVQDPEYCDPKLADQEEELMDFSIAQMELKEIYIKEQQESDNLPTYKELVGEQLSLNNGS